MVIKVLKKFLKKLPFFQLLRSIYRKLKKIPRHPIQDCKSVDLTLNASDIPLMKFDIEGAEIEVIKRCIDVGVTPRQILVEFDELNIPSPKGFTRVTEIDKLLRNNGYKLLKTDGQSDFLYFK